MPFEATFDPELRQSYKEKCGLFNLMSETGCMFIDGHMAGEWYGYNMDMDEKVNDFLDIKQYPHDPGINYPQFGTLKINPKSDWYCHSNGLLPEFQNRGFGTIMKAWMLAYLHGLGTERVIGHAHNKGSLQLNLKFGAVVHHEFKNWYDSGHSYFLYTIDV